MSPTNKYSSSPGASQQSPSGGQKKRNQSLTPATVKQLLNVKEPESMSYTIDDKPVSQVIIVGMILNVDVQATNTNYMIDDGSGQICVRLYTNDEAQDINSSCREDCYVKVVGNIRQIGGQKMVVAFQLTPITDFNVITLHALDVIHTHLKNTRGPLDAKGNIVQSANPMLNTVASSSYTMDAVSNDGMEPHQAQVLKVFETYSKADEQGTSITEVIQKLPSIDPSKIRDAVEFLSGEGHLYSTIDDQHFKCTSD